MRTFCRRKLEAAQRSLVFSHDHPDPNPAARISVSRLAELLALVVVLCETRCRCQREAAAAREERDRHLSDLRIRLADLLHLAAAVAVRESLPDLAIRFSRDARVGRIAYFVEVRRAISRARREEDLLLHYGLPDTLLGELEGDLLRYELAERRRAEREAEGAGAAATLSTLADEAYQLIRHLSALNRLRFAADPAAAEAWRAASTVEWRGRDLLADGTGALA
jgi:hypothetical protein